MATPHDHQADSRIDPEQLAMLLDGRLNAEQRTQLLAHLAQSPADIGVLSAAAAALGDIEASRVVSSARIEPRGGKAARFARRRYWLALAAVLAGITATPLLIRHSQSPSVDLVSRYALLAAGGSPPPSEFDSSPWSGSRSVTGPAAASATMWRLGARLVDLDVAVADSDTLAAVRFSLDVADLLEALSVSAATRSVYLDTARIRTGFAAGWRDEDRAARAEVAVQLHDERITLGAWLEAARIAASRHRAEFFAGSESQAAVSRLRALGVLSSDVADRIRVASLGGSDVHDGFWDDMGLEFRQALASR